MSFLAVINILQFDAPSEGRGTLAGQFGTDAWKTKQKRRERVLFPHVGQFATLSSLIIIIITLFQEDNTFGTDASLTNGPQIQRHTCVW